MKHASSKAREEGYKRLWDLGVLLSRLINISIEEQFNGKQLGKEWRNYMQLHLPEDKRGGEKNG